MPWNDATNMGLLTTELTRRFGGMVMKDGVAFAAVNGSHATATSLGNSLNSNLLCVTALNVSPTPSWICAAVVAAVVAGEPHPARPFQTLSLPGVLPPARTARWTRDQRDLLLHDGIATLVADQSGNVAIERMITTYQTNAAGVPDTSFLDVNVVLTYMACRDDMITGLALEYPRGRC